MTRSRPAPVALPKLAPAVVLYFVGVGFWGAAAGAATSADLEWRATHSFVWAPLEMAAVAPSVTGSRAGVPSETPPGVVQQRAEAEELSLGKDPQDPPSDRGDEEEDNHVEVVAVADVDEAEEVVPPQGVGGPPPLSACDAALELRFDRGSSDPDNLGDLREFVGRTQEHGKALIVVEGYASRKGPPSKNLRLSYRRAQRVARLLRARGVARRRIRVQAFGEYRPDLSGDDRRNRRVIVRLKGRGACEQSGGSKE